MSDSGKRIHFVGSAKEDLRDFPDGARQEAGHQLWRLERGLDPDHFKSMPDVGAGVAEIIIDDGDAFRVFYVAKFSEAIYVLHAFNKKTRKTSERDKDRGRQSYQTIRAIQRELKKNN